METALRELLNLASPADAPPYLRIGALSGILRHASIDGQLETPVMDASLRDQAINLAISILDQTAPTAEGASLTDEQYWMRRQSIQLLGAFRSPGTDGKVVAALRKVLDDPQSPLWVAADAVDADGSLAFASAEQADVPNAVKSIGGVVNRFFKADIAAMDDYISSIKFNRLLVKKSGESTNQVATDNVAPDDFGGMAGALAQRRGNATDRDEQAERATRTNDVEVPNYKINDIRQRTKSIVFIARRALDGLPPRRRNETKPPENLKKMAGADAETVKVIDQIVAALDRVMSETDLGPEVAQSTSRFAVVNEPQRPRTNDERLRDSLKAGIEAVDAAIGMQAPADGQTEIKAAVGG
jgi:hypothetical protein